MTREENSYTFDCSLHLKNVTVEDAGKYKVTARNDLGESNATISLNFDSDEAPVPQVRSGAKLHAVLLIAKILKLGFEEKNQKSLA